ncbi:hypothetical protein C2S53_018340 [Perilla frutescens var. hirtella]|uniref:C2 NT-type domain-containing protein n=1 Tax=Perilla frutescens var. hirtella TaxID=608512 RepID=A0AAD4JHX3_PERFH|nr:hypothetical protein C2S53_018340 [Perilla frutescens var. hirtella]
MFKQARWWSDKNRIKVVFKLQFHASQVAEVEGDGLMISVVPGDTGKPSVKSDKAAVRDGSCLWENPVYETVKFNRDPKSGKIHQRIYYLVLATGSSKSGIVGEASIDFSSYAEASKASLVSLPLKNSKNEAILHVSIQRVDESTDQREIEENENANLDSEDHSLNSQLGDHDADGTITSNSVEVISCVDAPFSKAVPQGEFNTKHRGSSGSDITLSSSGSSSGLETPWEMQMQMKNLSSLTTPGPKSDTPPIHKEHRRSWEWLTNSALEDIPNNTSSTPKETFLDEEEAPDILIERLRADVAALSRQADMSELELQALRKQVVKESKRGQDLWREVVCLKEERDALEGECKQLKALQRSSVEVESNTSLLFDRVDSQAVVEELRQELNHAKELNTNLRIQLEKTQESNSELILAVQDLEEMLEQKNNEIPISYSSQLERDVDGKSREMALVCQLDNNDDDEEQKALEDIVKEHSEVQESFLLEQEIVDLQNEIEVYKRDKDELEMQMEQLALDYEIMKQANHDMASKLEQSQIHEQLKMQYECSSPDVIADELGNRIENLENELQRRTKEHEDSLVMISELQANIESLEKELEKQARGFEADVEALTRSKVEQEQRAIRAEETLKKIRWKNANAAERLQEEFRKLSVQMASTFEANEKLATKALAEANELRLQKSHLEETLRRISEEHQSVEGHYEARLREVTSQVTLMTNQIEQLQLDMEERGVQLEHQKKQAEDTQKLLSDEILMLKEEIEEHIAKNKILVEEMGSEEALMHELEKMQMSVKEMALLVEQGNDEKIELESRVILMKTEAEEFDKELNRMRSLVKEKESTAANLQSELDSLLAQCTELKHSLSADEVEKQNLRRQVLQLRSDLNKKEDAVKIMEKKTRDGSGRATTVDAVKTASKTSKPSPRGSKEVANLKERIKLLESEIKLKETALEKSANAVLEKEKALHKKIEELEGRLASKQSSAQFCENEVKKPAAAVLVHQASNGKLSEEAGNIDENSSTTSTPSTTSSADYGAFLSRMSKDSGDNTAEVEEVKNEMALVMERNKSMDKELKEMQERYSEMSLKFAEVEGERQQLVMKLRNLTNAKNSTNLFAPVYW